MTAASQKTCSEEFSFGVCYSYRKTHKVASLYGQEYCGTVLKCMFTVRVSGMIDLFGMIRLWIDLCLTWWEPKNHSFSGFLKVSNGFGKENHPIFTYLNISTSFRNAQKKSNPKTTQRFETLGILTFTRFSGLKIDVSTGFPMHHWRLQQQRCGFGVGGGEFATGAGTMLLII